MSRREDGFMMIEVIAGALFLAITVGMVATMFVGGNRTSLAGQRQAAMVAVADKQIEWIRNEVKVQGFDKLAMSAAPAASSSATLSSDSGVQLDPNYFVSASSGCGASNQGYEIQANYDYTPEGPASGVTPWAGCAYTSGSVVAEPLEILSGGFVSPGPTSVTVGTETETATVDTYVTDTYVGCTSSLGGCPTISLSGAVTGCTFPSTTSSSTTCADARRVIVAVIPNATARQGTSQNSPVYVSTVFTNPTPSNQPTSSIGLTLGANIG